MKNVKTLNLVLMAVFACSAMVASVAQADAPRWTTASGTLAAGAEIAAAGESTGKVTLAGAGVNLESTSCTSSGRIVGSAANSPGTFTGTRHCTGVVVPGAPKCVVKSEGATTNGTIMTTLAAGRLVWLKQSPDVSSVGVTFEPDPGTSTAFTHIEITGVGCAATNKFTVTGNIICSFSPVGSDAENATLDCPATPIKKYFDNSPSVRQETEDTGLKIGAANATFIAHFVNIKLTGNVKWGVENG